ncbi:acetate--CoA ligase family protein [Bradyrhizobium sp. AUGA SZCCT0182]|uniref:acetate--CoA ligase family protein n=1 Tax=Bradyrhizobium sp. AUGA SZCCT0182 TaxID=2807667 RepID=UPI001BA6DBC7|nr:acetate--CoA ligase [Bradyrhizobium sp. AUGA SZCCT0182]MBR1231715.1 acetate--CoA ligase family protein [Bradyrhizobium sp. AUGA SZCCT0182]
MPSPNIVDVLYPRSIAVIGASKDPTKRGFRSIERLIKDGYTGTIYPVNPREPEILGLKCYRSIDDVPATVDLALVCTPAKTLPDLMQRLSSLGVKGAVVLAGGFAEADEEGKALQDEMVAIARRGGVRIIGPNTSGIFNTHNACNIVGFSNLRKGHIGLLSQSGNMALALVTEAEAQGSVGLSTYIGIGNESDVRFDEYLDYFALDPNTRVLIVYVEGIKDGPRFLSALRRLTATKPVVIYKSGRSEAGRSSAKSHTGALAGNYFVSQQVLKQAGAILAERSDEILPIAQALECSPSLRGRRIAVLADGGGHATIAADALSHRNFSLATLSAQTTEKLASILPPAASLGNPVDVAGGTDADPSVFAACTKALLEDPNVDGLLITGLFGGYAVRFASSLLEIELATTDAIGELAKQSAKPVLIHSLYSALQSHQKPRPLSRMQEIGVPVYASLDHAIRALEALAEFEEVRRKASSPAFDFGVRRQDVFDTVLANCRTEKRKIVLEHEGRAILEAAGAPVAPAYMAHNEKEAVNAFEMLGLQPVAMKVVSKDIVHKTEAGGVQLAIGSAGAVRSAYNLILDNARKYSADAAVQGVLVAAMAPKGGLEVIIGVTTDSTFGKVVMFGLGGTLVETLRDVVFRSLPIDEADAFGMLEEIKGRALLDGVRGAGPVDRRALVDLMLRVSDLAMSYSEIEEIDLNPTIVYPKGLSVIDVRMILN